MIYISNKIKDIIKSGQLTNGKYVQRLEESIKKYYNVKYCLATSSCTLGLMMCTAFFKPAYFDVSMFNWWSDKYLLDFLCQKIKWVDINKETWLPEEINPLFSLYINTFGNIGISKSKEAIYDSSHCLGAKIKDIGLANVFSLAPTKLITSCEGGLVITNNNCLYDFVKERRDRMARMSEIHAFIGLYYFNNYLDAALRWKKNAYEYYRTKIPGQFQKISENSSYNTIGFINDKKLLIPPEIETRQYYEPIHDNGLESNTKYVYENIVCLPSYYNCNIEKITELILNENNM